MKALSRTTFKAVSVIFPVILIAVVLFSAGSLSSCKKKEQDIPADTTRTMAPGFSLVTTSDDTLSLSEYQGDVVVLFFLGYGCKFCKESAPDVQQMLVNPYSGRTDYHLLGLDVWNGTPAQVESFRNETGVSFPLLMQASGVSQQYGTTNDRLVVIDRTGYIRFRGNQAAMKDVASAMDIVNQLLDIR